MKGLDKAIPKDMPLVIQGGVCLLWQEDNDWVLAMGSRKPTGWRKVFGRFKDQRKAYDVAKELGFNQIDVRSKNFKKWHSNPIVRDAPKNWQSIYRGIR